MYETGLYFPRKQRAYCDSEAVKDQDMNVTSRKISSGMSLVDFRYAAPE
jgi:hypothetical protein